MFVPASQTEPVVFIYERALVYIVLDIRDMIAEHDCMAKICLPIMPEQLRIPDDSKFSSGGLEVPKRSRFILSFLCFFFFLYTGSSAILNFESEACFHSPVSPVLQTKLKSLHYVATRDFVPDLDCHHPPPPAR